MSCNSTVVVLRREEREGFGWESELSRTIAILSTFATFHSAVNL